MRTLEVKEVQLVSGGDSWGGTPEGQASTTPYQDCVNAGFASGSGSVLGVMLFCLHVFL
jgi:hypothetical protein